MNCWKVLKIKATSDAREIKKAYARELRLHNPEDDPDGFMRLREAYESALKKAQYKTVADGISKEPAQPDDSAKERPAQPGGVPEEPAQPDDAQVGSIQPDDAPVAARKKPEEAKRLEPAVLLQAGDEERPEILYQGTQPGQAGEKRSVDMMLADIYDDFDRRVDPAEWRRMLGSLSVNELQTLNWLIAGFLNDNYVLPGDIWRFLDAEFNVCGDPYFRWEWLTDETHDVCGWILSVAGKIRLAGVDIAEYAKLRVNAYIAYETDDLAVAENLARQAIKMFEGDYLTYRMLGYCLYSEGDAVNASSAYEKSLALSQDDDVEYSLALARMQIGEYKQAAALFRLIRNRRYKKEELAKLRPRILKCEELYVECRYKMRRMTKFGYTFRKHRIEEIKNMRKMTPRKYWRIFWICIAILVIMVGGPFVLALIHGQL